MRTLLITSKPSRAGTALARALGIRKMSPSRRTMRISPLVLNWGCSLPKYRARYNITVSRFINNPEAVRVAANKLLCFQRLSEDAEIPLPGFTVEPLVAHQWGGDVVERRVLTGHSGEGIVIRCQGEGTGVAPLYVQYKKKAHEYRVHVVGDVTDVQQKRKRQETPNEEVDYQVRNHQNGWVYCREDIDAPEGIEELSVRVVRQLGLDFGAVDIIWNRRHNQMWVLECNCAPGLEGQTIEFYRDNLRRLL